MLIGRRRVDSCDAFSAARPDRARNGCPSRRRNHGLLRLGTRARAGLGECSDWRRACVGVLRSETESVLGSERALMNPHTEPGERSSSPMSLQIVAPLVVALAFVFWGAMRVAQLGFGWCRYSTPDLKVFRLADEHVVAWVSQRWLVVSLREH